MWGILLGYLVFGNRQKGSGKPGKVFPNMGLANSKLGSEPAIFLKMEHANSFRDLEVYKLSRRLAKEIFEVSKGFPKDEMYSLTDQLRRSSRSVGAQLAEAWGKRKYKKHFVNKLIPIAIGTDGEQLETQHWIETAMDCSYFSNELGSGLLSQCNSIGEMLNSMMNKSDQFCKT